MQSLTIYQLRNLAERHFTAVEATEGIDQFCSSLDWILPAHEAFIPDHPLHLRSSEDGFATLARGFNPRIGRYLQPLEASWCLASPFVGANVDGLIDAFADECETRLVDWDLLYLSGIPPDGPMMDRIVAAFGARHQIGRGHHTRRFVASLDGGVDGYLGRRSSKFRLRLRQARAEAANSGVTYEVIRDVADEEVAALYDRILAVEERSWKGLEGTGILDGGMNTFYRLMLPRLARRGGLRVVFACAEERDIAFVFGGVFANQYRGLQLSYDDTFARLSPGNLVQIRMIEALAQEGVATYDLGSELDYKRRWAELSVETVTLWVWR